MPFTTWLRNLISSPSRDRRVSGTARKPAGFRPRLEDLEGRALPSFAVPVTYAESAPHAVVTADVNGDGKPDLISLVNSGITYISVRLNKGNGKFGPEQASFDFLRTDTALAVGDVTGDGKPDLVLANALGSGAIGGVPIGSISVLVGSGTGHFTYAGSYDLPTGGSPITSLALADLNGDGTLDVVGAAGASVFAALNDYGGMSWSQGHTYLDPTAAAVGGFSLQVAVGDVTGDGKPDIVAAGYGTVCVFQNGGGGTFGIPQTFATPKTYAVGGSATSVALGDFNGDGELDIVTANTNSTASVLLNSGPGAFGVARTYAVGGAATSVAVGDFNGDGKLDIATTGAEMDVLLNKGTGTFAAYQNSGPAGTSIVAGDFDGDGFLDVAQIDASGASIDVLHNKANWPKK